MGRSRQRLFGFTLCALVLHVPGRRKGSESRPRLFGNRQVSGRETCRFRRPPHGLARSSVAMAYTRGLQLRISVSGQGGTKLFRHNFGEQIGNVAGTGEYPWMAGKTS